MLVERVIVARVFVALASLARQTTPVHESPASHTCIEMYYKNIMRIKCCFRTRLKTLAYENVVLYALSVKILDFDTIA